MVGLDGQGFGFSCGRWLLCDFVTSQSCRKLIMQVIIRLSFWIAASSNIFSCVPKESKGVDEDGDQEHRSHRKVLQRQNHHRVRDRGVGGGADRPEDPATKRAERGHRRNGQSSEENVRLLPQPNAFMFTTSQLFLCAFNLVTCHWTFR